MKKYLFVFFISINLFSVTGCEKKILTGTRINSIYSDSEKDMWIAGQNGFYRIKDGEYKNIKNILKDKEIIGIAEDSKNNLYLGNGKKIIYFNTGKETEENIIEPTGMGRQDSFVTSVAVDNKDNLWVGRYNDLTVMYDGKKIKSYPVWDVSGIGFSNSGEVWLAAKTGVYCIKSGVVSEFNQENSDLPDNDIKAILVDAYDNVWLATNSGLVKYNSHIWITYNKENSPLKDNQVTSLTKGNGGSLVIGMSSGDLQIITNNHWEEIKSGLKNEAIRNIVVDTKNVFLLGTDSGLWVCK